MNHLTMLGCQHVLCQFDFIHFRAGKTQSSTWWHAELKTCLQPLPLKHLNNAGQLFRCTSTTHSALSGVVWITGKCIKCKLRNAMHKKIASSNRLMQSMHVALQIIHVWMHIIFLLLGQTVWFSSIHKHNAYTSEEGVIIAVQQSIDLDLQYSLDFSHPCLREEPFMWIWMFLLWGCLHA